MWECGAIEDAVGKVQEGVWNAAHIVVLCDQKVDTFLSTFSAVDH